LVLNVSVERLWDLKRHLGHDRSTLVKGLTPLMGANSHLEELD
jgi:hypothetical protein